MTTTATPKRRRKKKWTGGTCYHDSLTALVNGDHPLGEGAVLVHGIGVIAAGPYKGRRFNHAWLESANRLFAYDAVKNVLALTFHYYRAGSVNPDESIVYTFEEMRRLVLETEHSGPWHQLPEGVL